MTIQKEMSLPVRLPDGSSAPALGMGSWRLAEGRHPINQEIEALSVGLSLGVSLIDTAEIYGNGASEKMIGKVISDRRSRITSYNVCYTKLLRSLRSALPSKPGIHRNDDLK